MGKVVIVTCEEIFGVKPGREERSDFVIHSGEQAFREGTVMSKSALKADIKGADQVFVYVGKTGIQPSLELLQAAKAAGKQTFMFGCRCEESRKLLFQKELRIEWFITKCGSVMAEEDLLDLVACGVRR